MLAKLIGQERKLLSHNKINISSTLKVKKKNLITPLIFKGFYIFPLCNICIIWCYCEFSGAEGGMIYYRATVELFCNEPSSIYQKKKKDIVNVVSKNISNIDKFLNLLDFTKYV